MITKQLYHPTLHLILYIMKQATAQIYSPWHFQQELKALFRTSKRDGFDEMQ